MVYWLAAPTVSDSSPGKLPQAAPVHYELDGEGTTLTLVLSKEWLSSPERVFPVKIDPDVYFNGGHSCSILSASSANTSFCGNRLYIGDETKSPAHVARAMVYFDVSSIPKQSAILSSNLALWFEADTTTSTLEIEARALTRAWSPGATWNDYDGTHAWSSAGGDFLKTEAGASPIKNEYKGSSVRWGFTPQIEQWVREPSSNFGILLKAKNEAVNGYDTFVQTENSEHAHEPSLQVIYEQRLGNAANQAMYQQELGNGGTLGVNVANGNLHLQTPDVNYVTEGYDTQLAREYNSQYDDLNGSAFGPQWSISMGENTLLHPAWWDGSNYLTQPDGSYTRFDRAPWADGHPATGDKAFTGEAYVPDTLTVHENGTRTLTENATGVIWQFDKSEAGYPQTITDPGGEGNKISLSYTESRLTKATDTHGHELTLTRDKTTKNITTITSKTKETWTYKYAKTTGFLESYAGPAGQKAEYQYNGEGGITAVIEPAGTTVITYGEHERVASLRKLVNGTIGKVGSEDETTTFSYETEQTTVTHPTAATSVYYYDAFGNALEEPATQLLAAEAYGHYASIGLGTAQTDVARQDHSSILDSQLSQQLGANYTGEWFNASTNGVAVGITSAGYEKTVEQDLDNLGLANSSEIVTSAHSRTELEEAEGSDATALAELDSHGLTRLGLELSTNSVTVEKADDLTSSQSSHLAEVVAHATVPIVVTEQPAARFHAFAEACTGVRCTAPIRGGVTIQEHEKEEGQERTKYCTAGFIMGSKYGPGRYVLTAGHCILEGHGVGKGWETGFPGDTGALFEQFGDRFIGHAAGYIYGHNHSSLVSDKSEGDAGIIEIENSKEIRGTGLQPWVIDYGNSETARNEHYLIRGTHYNPYGDAPQEKFTICMGGATIAESYVEAIEKPETERPPYAEERCSVTEGQKSPTFDEGGTHEATPQNLEQFKSCGGGSGDSGEPVYKIGLAVGIVSGGEESEEGKCKTWYEGISTAEAALGVHILAG